MTPLRSPGNSRGFTLVELLVSLALLTFLLLLLVSMTDATRRTWSQTTGKIEEFHDAREAFETISRKLSQATLNTYWDYQRDSSGNIITNYMRQSELRFICAQTASLNLPSMKDLNGNPISLTTHSVFFQAPLGYTANTSYTGFKNLLNTCGYFIEFGSDQPFWPQFLQGKPSPPAPQPRYRFRLMELLEPSDSLTLYNYTSGTNSTTGAANNMNYVTNPPLQHLTQPSGVNPPTGTGLEWFANSLSGTSSSVRVLAENIVAMVLLPKLSPGDQTAGNYTDASLAPYYNYDSTAINSDPNLNSRNQLPPVVQMTLVAVDESSFNRLMAVKGVSLPDLGLGSLFQNAANYQADLDQLQANLLQASFKDSSTGNTYTPKVTLPVKVNYRIFTTNVSLKAAKWSRNQLN